MYDFELNEPSIQNVYWNKIFIQQYKKLNYYYYFLKKLNKLRDGIFNALGCTSVGLNPSSNLFNTYSNSSLNLYTFLELWSSFSSNKKRK